MKTHKHHRQGRAPVPFSVPPLSPETLRSFARQQTALAAMTWAAALISAAVAVASELMFGASNRTATMIAAGLAACGAGFALVFSAQAAEDWRAYKKAQAKEGFRG